MPGSLAFPLCPSYPFYNPYSPWLLVASAAALALAIEAAALAYSQRAIKGAQRQPWLAVPVWGLGVWALLLTAWTWIASSTFVEGPCAEPAWSWPVPPDNAPGVAGLASATTALAAGILFVAGAVVVLRRLRGRHAPAVG
jgi:hypothetical protein